MRIFFDVDNTLIAWDGSLRPHVKEVFQKLKEQGHQIYVWSGVGLRWEVVKEHQLEPFIETCFVKPIENYRTSLQSLGVTISPEFVVDDHPEVIQAFGGFTVRPYYFKNHEDAEMLRVYDTIMSQVNGTNGTFAPPPYYA